MSFDGMKVDHAGLDTAHGDITSQARQMDSRLDDLEGQLNRLMPYFTGQASTAYEDARRKWDAKMREMQMLLTQIGSTVATSNAEYRAADMRGAGRFGG